MKDELFDQLMASLREGGAVLRGERTASRRFVIDAPDVKRIRARYNLPQAVSPPCWASAWPRFATGSRGAERPKGLPASSC